MAASGKRDDEWMGEAPSRDTMVDAVPTGALEAPPSGERIGAIVAGRYRVERLLGSGAHAAVFGGVDQHTGDAVAVKVLHDRLAHDRDHVARLLHEAEIMREIAHPGVVRVMGAGQDEGGRWYIAIELLEGEDLATAIERGPLDAALVVEIGHQLLATLAAAHARGIIHRDVKPENVFLARDELGSLRVKLLDFGVAKSTEARASSPVHRTHDGVKIGTPHYMSPEQWAGLPLDARSDVWAAAAVLFTATVGVPPFDADDLGTLMTRVTETDAPSLAALRPEIGPAFVDTIDRALATDPADRWPDARAMAAALHVGGARVDALDWDE
ncbi:serine/threonine-protein kinase [Sandaracinus amylolyticus]|uniref:serine/threonine-protein kinase n=1 Tax=Sandaracinus amylolyticus TaxID=927083 RepID=UPI001F2A8B0F|nr:serine/threonine-protein kinase [Sandaracinus amylolyticus]